MCDKKEKEIDTQIELKKQNKAARSRERENYLPIYYYVRVLEIFPVFEAG